MIDVIDALHNGTREHEQQIFKARIQFSSWSTRGDISNLNTREVSAQRMNKAQSAIAREMETVKMSTIDFPRHAVTQVLQSVEQRESTRGTVGQILEIELAFVIGSGTARRICKELECATHEGEAIAITETATVDWTSEVSSNRRRVVIKEDEKRWA